MNSQTLVVTILMLLAAGRCSESMPMPDCPTSCVNLTIPYPFRIPNSQFPARVTEFTAIGHDTYPLHQCSEGWNKMGAGCFSWCVGIKTVRNGNCSGIGCFRSSIPESVKDFMVNINVVRSLNSFNCDFELKALSPSRRRSNKSQNKIRYWKSDPDWSVGNPSRQEVQLSRSAFCSANSECIDSSSGVGCRCRCLTGFQGNPYLVDGCQDINECIVLEPCQGTCTNLNGSYSCSCPQGFKGDGKKDGLGCYPQGQISRSILFFISSLFMVPAVGISWIIWRRKQKKVEKLRRGLFVRNGGVLLDAMQPIQKTLSIFTAEDLKKATNDYDENNVLYQDHSGITYKGILTGMSQIVTVKSCHAFDHCNLEVLISNLVAISQINHKNVVKLLGCCLETQTPLVVNEFITGQSLLDCIIDDRLSRSLSWDIRLRIAADIAGVVAYMHSATSMPIIHGSLNSSSILLHHGYTVKVLGFALACLGCSCVQFHGHTSGYMDPDYFSSSRLTEKSDVYSFGFILAELMTGKDVMSPEWLEGENIAEYFIGLSSGAELNTVLDDRVMDDYYLGQLTEVSEIAKLCLSSSSQERPTMKEVVVALECIIFRNSRQSSTQTQATRKLLVDSTDKGSF